MHKKLFALFLCLFILLTIIPISSLAEETSLRITQQPKDCTAKTGTEATVSVTAQGDGLKYQWYFKNVGMDAFSKSGVTSPTYSCEMSPIRNGRSLYCVISDQYGNSVTSKTVTLKAATKLKITAQPASVQVPVGTQVTAFVKAQGDGLKYQWFCKDAGSSGFVKSSITDPSYSCKMNDARNGRQIYCVITDRYGDSVTSNTVTLKAATKLKITAQPKNAYAKMGTNVTTSVSAQGDGLKYQWYFKNTSMDSFSKAGVTSRTYSCEMSKTRNGRSIYCVITDRYGHSVTSTTVVLKAPTELAIVTQPKNFYADSGEQVKVTVAAQGDELKYQWYFKNTGMDSFSKAGVTSSTYSCEMSKVRHGRKIYCVITDCHGNSLQTNTVTIYDNARLKQVALTFDDGPSDHTARLLDYLEDHEEIKVSFFMVGNRMNSYTTSVKRMAEQGHELGYHSYSHQTQTGLSDSQIQSDLAKSNKILKNITGKEFTLWRTPGGNYNSRVLNAVSLPHIMWSVDTRDWANRNSSSVYSSVVNSSKDGSIVLMHDLYGTTVDGAIAAMEKMLEEGYEFVTVSELLSRDGTPPAPSTSYNHG